MKAVIYIIAFVVLVVAAFFGVGFVLPTSTHVERSIEIDAAPGVVFSFVADHQEFQKWSPWSSLDPNMEVKFSGPDVGLGSEMYWKGNEDVGEGTSTFIEYQPNSRATVALDFGAMGGGTSSYILESQDGGDKTKLTWTFDTEHKSPIERYIGVLMDGMLGPSYESGLADLKTLAESAPKIKSKEVSYSLGDTELTGYLAYPLGMLDPAPGVLVVHEWWGHNDYSRKRADMLAELGYVAFALDMYGDGKVTDHPKNAGEFMQEVGTNTELAQQRFDAGLDMLMQNPMVNQTKIGAVGYCFGGSVVINMARAGKPLAGVVSFHGGLGGLVPVAEEASAEVLVLNGAADPFIKAEDIDSFKSSMEAADYEYEFINYPDAKHAFTNPGASEVGEKFGIPLAYNEEADKQSWEKMKSFFNEVFY